MSLLADEHISAAPADPQGWFARGLAAQRLWQGEKASVAFDGALARLDESDRARIDRIERVLGDSARRMLAARDSATRDRIANLYWATADPLWSRPGPTPRTEFLARVAHAEFRWTVPDLRIRGADTDRGDAYVRWGPPDRVVGIGAPGDVGTQVSVITYWWSEWGLLLAFEGSPRMGVARTAFGDAAYVASLKNAALARWNNIVHEEVEDLPARVARFRAGRDTAEVVIASSVPVEVIRNATDVMGGVRADLFLTRWPAQDAQHDSLHIARGPERSTAFFVARIGAGDWLYRLEASADGSLRAGRASGTVRVAASGDDAFPTAGFGMSDLLVASGEARATPARRWRDLGLTPEPGAIRQGGMLGIVWENYEFGERDGASSYTVVVEIRADRDGRPIALRALDAIRGVLGAGDAGGATSVTFDRVRPHSPVLADYVMVSLAAVPPGRYRIEVRVKDAVTGRETSRPLPVNIGR